MPSPAGNGYLADLAADDLEARDRATSALDALALAAECAHALTDGAPIRESAASGLAAAIDRAAQDLAAALEAVARHADALETAHADALAALEAARDLEARREGAGLALGHADLDALDRAISAPDYLRSTARTMRGVADYLAHHAAMLEEGREGADRGGSE